MVCKYRRVNIRAVKRVQGERETEGGREEKRKERRQGGREEWEADKGRARERVKI